MKMLLFLSFVFITSVDHVELSEKGYKHNFEKMLEKILMF